MRQGLVSDIGEALSHLREAGFVHRDVKPSLDWSIEEAINAVMSGGVLMSDTVPLVGVNDAPFRQ